MTVAHNRLYFTVNPHLLQCIDSILTNKFFVKILTVFDAVIAKYGLLSGV